MITFRKLGRFGRLGNQMFQIAAVIGASIRHEMPARFPKWEYAQHFKGTLDQSLGWRPFLKVYRERGYPYQNIPAGSGFPFSGLDLEGYFQSEKYFEHCTHKIREIFSPADEIEDILEAKYGHWLSHPQTCSIHVRRTDYLRYQDYHPLQTIAYYESCMAAVPGDAVEFLVFSDDIAWCKSAFLGPNIHFIEEERDVVALQLMARCKHNIIANSSFSWWGAWLNLHPEKKVFAPRNWFGPQALNHDIRDLIPANWVKK